MSPPLFLPTRYTRRPPRIPVPPFEAAFYTALKCTRAYLHSPRFFCKPSLKKKKFYIFISLQPNVHLFTILNSISRAPRRARCPLLQPISARRTVCRLRYRTASSRERKYGGVLYAYNVYGGRTS